MYPFSPLLSLLPSNWLILLDPGFTDTHQCLCDRTSSEKAGVYLSRSYREILDEARMRKHTHKHIIQ
jgi:hypothetical protein